MRAESDDIMKMLWFFYSFKIYFMKIAKIHIYCNVKILIQSVYVKIWMKKIQFKRV